MENKVTNLRQAKTKLEVVGVLSEMSLKEEIFREKEVIRGDVVLQTDEYNFIRFDVFVGKITNSGEPNSAYTGLKTVMDTYKSIAEVGKEAATIVKVRNGQVRPSSFPDKRTGAIVENVRYSTSYFEHANQDDDFKAEFDLEMFVDSIRDEISKDEETLGEPTGRKIVRGWVPLYNNGIDPIELIAPEDIADAMEEIQPGETVRFYGEAKNNKIEQVIEIPMRIGKPKREIKTTYINELVITGASEAYVEEKAYDPEVIRKALVERDVRLEEAKKKAASSTDATTKTTTTRKMPNW